jgi:regulator of protease activity HflC (stomatin/prohibitin superfamily)
MKKIKLTALLLLGVGTAACTRIEPGEVGVKVNRYGSGSGVENNAVGVGTYFSLWGVDYIPYPVSTQTYTWSRGAQNEDGTTTSNQEISFQDKNGLIVSADATVAFRVNPKLAPKLYQIYRMDMEALVAGPIRNKVRSEIVKAASTMTVEQVYSSGKTVLINRALAGTRRYFEPMGLNVDQLEWAGPIRIPENIQERINARAQTEQAAIAARAQVETERAKGEASVAKATAEATARKIQAESEANAIRTRAEAIATNQKIVAYEWVKRWNGQMPQTVYCSAAQPCVQGGQ